MSRIYPRRKGRLFKCPHQKVCTARHVCRRGTRYNGPACRRNRKVFGHPEREEVGVK